MSTDAEPPEPQPTPDEVAQAEIAMAKIHERFEREVHDRRGLVRDKTRSYDAMGRNQPRRLSLLTIFRALPPLLQRMRAVPASAIEEQVFDEDRDEALLNCPCGAHPVAPRLEVVKCPGCERWYLYVQRVFVIYGNMEPPAAQPDVVGKPAAELEG